MAALKANDTEAIATELRTTGRTANGVRLAGLEKRADERANMVLASAAAPVDETKAIAAAGEMAGTPGASAGSTIYVKPIVIRHELKAA